MNRPGAVPQSLRGIPAGFGGQPPQRPGRAVSNQIPNGKSAANGSGWAFGSGNVPSSAGVLQNPPRQLGGGSVSFAQSLGGSQPATPLDPSRPNPSGAKPALRFKNLRAFPAPKPDVKQTNMGLPYASVLKGEFPSLSNNPQLGNAGQTSMWATGGRNLGAPIPRGQGTPLGSQTAQQQQEDIFSNPSRLSSAQGSFRFGNPPSVNQASQSQATSVDEFPPLNRNTNGDIGQERGAGLISNFGFGATGATAGSTAQPNRVGNGLLNALSQNTRVAEVRSPTLVSQSREGRSSVGDDDTRAKNGPFREDSIASQPSLLAGQGGPSDIRNPHGVIGNDPSNSKSKENKDNGLPEVQDPLAGLSPADRFGLKGLRHLMNVHPDYNALLGGVDPTQLGIDLTSNDMISTSIYSLFSDEPPRPSVPKFRLPECYQVNNVQPIENKIGGFNEETLMWIFYSCPGDVKQQLAAIELNNRNWRWHKKLQIWLTKDDLMVPQVLSPNHERGFYIIWDTLTWRKERVRDFTLHYADLDPAPQPVAV